MRLIINCSAAFSIAILQLVTICPGQALDMRDPGDSEAPIRQDLPSPDIHISREEWRHRVEAAKARAQEFRALARTGAAKPPERTLRDIAREASDNALNDQGLRPGDILSTVDGLVIYRGQAGHERQPSDFEPLPRGGLSQTK